VATIFVAATVHLHLCTTQGGHVVFGKVVVLMALQLHL
jgi:hypothetical protein